MRKGKKQLAALLILAMTMSLGGCGKEKEESVNKDLTPTPTTEAQKDEKEPSPTEPAGTQEPTPTEEPKYDFKGRVLKIGSYYDMTPTSDGNAYKQALAERIAFVEENYNCTIEFVTIPDDYNAAYITSVLSGDPICDIGYVLSYRLLPALIEGGIAYPVSDLGVFDFNDYKWRPDYVEAGTYKEKNYSFLTKDPEVRYGIFWNKTLFQKYGLPDLYELYENDEWTWEKFREICLAGNQDLDNDGTMDIWGFNERENLEWCYLYSNGADVVSKTDTGVEVDLSDPKIIEALEEFQDFSQNVPHEGGWLGDWQQQMKNFRDGKIMMCLEEFWISYAYLNEMQDEFGFVPFPKGPSATDWSCYGKEVAPRFMLNGIDNPEEAALIYDLITDVVPTDEDWDDLMEAQLEAWADDAKTVEICMDIFNNGLIKINPINGFGDLKNAVNDMFNDIKSGASTPQTAIETYNSKIQAAVADIQNHDYNEEMQEQMDAYLNPEEEETTE